MAQPRNKSARHGLGSSHGTRLDRKLARIGAVVALATAIGTGGAALAADITGTDGPDVLIGTPKSDVIRALGGNDRAEGRGGNDQIFGGDGRDALQGQDGNDLVDGGDGEDVFISGGDGNDVVLDGAGGDDLDGDAGNDVLRAGTGDDALFGEDDNDDMSGEAGDDELFGGEGDDLLKGGEGADELQGEAGVDRNEGGADDDQFDFDFSGFRPHSTFAASDLVVDFEGAGRPGGDTLQVSGGDFAWVGRINANPKVGAVLPGGGDGLTQLGYIQSGGATFLIADTNDDGRLNANDFTVRFQGSQNLTPEDFDNTSFIIAGTNGDDTITGTEGDDRIFAAGGNDTVTALGGNDEVHGGTGDDSLDGGPGGFDNLFGEEGNDELTLATSDGGGVASGGVGDDVLFGSDTSFSAFDNTLQGDAGNDDLHAGAVGSTLNAGSGADRLFSSAADDQFDAGRDENTFELDNGPDLLVYTGTGRWSTEGSFFGDTVFSFQDGSDLFDLRGSGLTFSDLTIVNEDFQVTITSDRGQITIFPNFGEPVVIDANDFLF